MIDIEKPTCEQLWNEELKHVQRNPDPSWRHGTRERDIFHREADDTYWEACYRMSTDGETNELREGIAKIEQVIPVQETVTVYKRLT